MESKALLRCFYSPTMLRSINIHDIARSLKISTSTVSRALNESSRISAKTITLVKKKAKALEKSIIDFFLHFLGCAKSDNELTKIIITHSFYDHSIN